jgi:hypothetical protein
LYVETPDLTRQTEDRIVAWTEPCTAMIDADAAWQLLGPHATADAVAGFEHDD